MTKKKRRELFKKLIFITTSAIISSAFVSSVATYAQKSKYQINNNTTNDVATFPNNNQTQDINNIDAPINYTTADLSSSQNKVQNVQNNNINQNNVAQNSNLSSEDISSKQDRALVSPEPDFWLNSNGAIINSENFNDNYTIYNHIKPIPLPDGSFAVFARRSDGIMCTLKINSRGGLDRVHSFHANIKDICDAVDIPNANKIVILIRFNDGSGDKLVIGALNYEILPLVIYRNEQSQPFYYVTIWDGDAITKYSFDSTAWRIEPVVSDKLNSNAWVMVFPYKSVRWVAESIDMIKMINLKHDGNIEINDKQNKGPFNFKYKDDRYRIDDGLKYGFSPIKFIPYYNYTKRRYYAIIMGIDKGDYTPTFIRIGQDGIYAHIYGFLPYPNFRDEDLYYEDKQTYIDKYFNVPFYGKSTKYGDTGFPYVYLSMIIPGVQSVACYIRIDLQDGTYEEEPILKGCYYNKLGNLDDVDIDLDSYNSGMYDNWLYAKPSWYEQKTSNIGLINGQVLKLNMDWGCQGDESFLDNMHVLNVSSDNALSRENKHWNVSKAVDPNGDFKETFRNMNAIPFPLKTPGENIALFTSQRNSNKINLLNFDTTNPSNNTIINSPGGLAYKTKGAGDNGTYLEQTSNDNQLTITAPMDPVKNSFINRSALDFGVEDITTGWFYNHDADRQQKTFTQVVAGDSKNDGHFNFSVKGINDWKVEQTLKKDLAGKKWSYFGYKGILPVNIRFNQGYVVDGVIKKEESEPVVALFTGFKKWETSLSVTEPVPVGEHKIKNVDANNVTNEQVKEFLVNHRKIYELFKDLPIPEDFKDDFNVEIKKRDKYAKSITVDITLNRWINDKHLLLENAPHKFGTITITGLKALPPTQFDNNIEQILPDAANYWAGNYPTEKITKHIIDNLILNKPTQPDELTNNDLIISFNPLNGERQIIVDVQLKKYINEQGVLIQNDENNGPRFQYIFINFKRQLDTLVNNPIQITCNDFASKYKGQTDLPVDIKNLIIQANPFQNTVYDAEITVDDILVASTTSNDMEGSLNVSITIKNNKSWTKGEINNEKTFQNIKLLGFRTTQPTDYVRDVVSLDAKQPSRPASGYTETEIKELILTHSKEIFINLPEQFGVDNIDISQKKTNDINGSISLTVKTNVYFDASGNLVTGKLLEPGKEITIIGFSQDTSTTSISNPTVLENVSDIRPSELTNQDNTDINEMRDRIKEAIIPKIQNPGKADINSKDLRLKGWSNPNNIDGTIVVDITLKNGAYKENGQPVSSDHEFKGITLSGLAVNLPTQIVDATEEISVKGHLLGKASDYVDNISAIKQFIMKPEIIDKFVLNPADGKLLDSDFDVKVITPNNSEGKLTIELTLNKYNDENGLLIEQLLGPKRFTLKDFDKEKLTLVVNQNPSFTLASASNKSPSECDSNDVLTVINQNLNQIWDPLPKTELTLDDLEIGKITPDNVNGSVTVPINIKTYFDKNGTQTNAQPLPELSINLTINGFIKGDLLTTVIRNQIRFQNTASFKASQWNTNENQLAIKNLIITGKHVSNLKPGSGNLMPEDIELSNPININDASGTIQLTVTITNESKAWVDGISQTVSQDVIFSNFITQQPTAYKKNPTLNITSHNLFPDPIYPNQINTSQIQELIFSEKVSVFDNLPTEAEGFTKDSIIVDESSIKPNIENGTLTVTIKINKYYDQNGLLNTDNSTLGEGVSVTINGFLSGGTTTTIDDTLDFDPQAQFKPSQWNDNVNAIKDAIINKGIVHNLASGASTLVYDDITIDSPTNINDVEGTIQLMVKISSNKAWVDGTNQEVSKLVTFTNLKKQPITAYKNDPTFAGDNTIYASSVTPQKIKELIFENKIEVFENLPTKEDGFSIDNITIEEETIIVDNLAGTIMVKAFINMYYGVNGLVSGALNDGVIITITDFKHDKLNTFVDDKIAFPETPDFKPSEWSKNQGKIKTLIKEGGHIHDLNPNASTQLDISHITLSGGDDYNDANGTITLNVTISGDVAWKDGEPQEITQPVSFTNLKKQQKTTFKTETTIQINGQENNLTTNFDKTTAKSYVKQNLDLFIEYYPENLSESDWEIIDYDNNTGVVDGVITFKLQLNKYYDETGNITNGQMISPEFKLIGFSKDKKTTSLADNITLNGVSDIKPTDLIKLDLPLNTKQQVIQAIIPHIQNPADTIDLADIDVKFSNPNDKLGTIQVIVTLKNGTHKLDGIVSSGDVNLPIVTIGGFTQQKPTSYVENKNIRVINISKPTNEFTIKEAQEYIANNPTQFFVNAPIITQQDIIITEFNNTDGLSTGTITLNIQLTKYYDTEGLLVENGQALAAAKFTLTGFYVESLVTTSFIENNEFKNITTKSLLFKQIFGNDKGFMVDWNYGQVLQNKQETLKQYIATNMSVFVSGYEAKDMTTEISQVQFSVSNENVNWFNVSLTFTNWFTDSIPGVKIIENAMTIKLNATPEGKPIINNALQDIYSKNDLSIDQIKQVVAKQLNDSKHILPDAIFPTGRDFMASDLDTLITQENVIKLDNKLTIGKFTITGPTGVELIFEEVVLEKLMTPTKDPGRSSGLWIIVGALTALIMLIIILTIVYITKRKKMIEGLEN